MRNNSKKEIKQTRSKPINQWLKKKRKKKEKQIQYWHVKLQITKKSFYFIDKLNSTY